MSGTKFGGLTYGRSDMPWTFPRLTVDQDVAGSTPVSHPL